MCRHGDTLRLQGSYLNMLLVDSKLSNTVHYNWNVSDDLVKFVVKARLNSMAHVLNGCMQEFKNFYSRRHDRIVDKIYDVMKDRDSCYETINNKCVDTVLPVLWKK